MLVVALISGAALIPQYQFAQTSCKAERTCSSQNGNGPTQSYYVSFQFLELKLNCLFWVVFGSSVTAYFFSMFGKKEKLVSTVAIYLFFNVGRANL